MSTCNPSDLTPDFNPEDVKTPAIPGYPTPKEVKVPDVGKPPDGGPYDSYGPDDLSDIFDNLKLLLPPGTMQPALSPSNGKNKSDGLLKLMDYLFPYLMTFKLFMPLLNMVICIIEVFCSLNNPYKTILAVKKLFSKCLPEFLNLFPIFSLVIVIISMLLLLLTLIEYILLQVEKLVTLILNNLKILEKAFVAGNAESVSAGILKLSALLCSFKNLFVILSIFNVILQIIKEIINTASSIPPCSDSSDCCTSDVCPDIVKTQYTRTTGNFKYLNAVYERAPIAGVGNIDTQIRSESYQLYDNNQDVGQKFIEMANFFPTDSSYNASTNINQAAYRADLRLFYNPSNFGRIGTPRYIRFNDCIVTNASTTSLKMYDNSISHINNGVLLIAGGKGYEDDNSTQLNGFAADGITPIGSQATLENFIHFSSVYKTLPSTTPNFYPSDGYMFSSVEYTFKPIQETLYNKSIITIGCTTDVSIAKSFINSTIGSDIALKTNLLQNIQLPDIQKTIDCLNVATSTLRSSLNEESVANFSSTVNICINDLKNQTISAVNSLIPIGFDPCKSTFEVLPTTQFTNQSILIKVHINDKSGTSLTQKIPQSVANSIAQNIKAHITFGDVSKFTYDGSEAFTATITAVATGSGKVSISYDNNLFCNNVFTSSPPVHEILSTDYDFIYAPSLDITSERQASDGPMPSRIGDFGNG